MMVRHLSPALFSVNSEHSATFYKTARNVETHARRTTLEDPGALDKLTASLTDLVSVQHASILPPKSKQSRAPRHSVSVPISPPTEPQQLPQTTTPCGQNAKDAAGGPAQGTHRPQEPAESYSAPSAPIRIMRPPGMAPHFTRRDSYAPDSPQSVPMVRTISNALTSQPTSYAPSRYMSCEYSECGSFRPNLDALHGAPLSRRISTDQPGRSRLHVFRDHLNQNTRPPSTERHALLDAWRRAEMDPPNGAREDGTEHCAFLTDEELQAAQAAEAYSPLPQDAFDNEMNWPRADFEL